MEDEQVCIMELPPRYAEMDSPPVIGDKGLAKIYRNSPEGKHSSPKGAIWILCWNAARYPEGDKKPLYERFS